MLRRFFLIIPAVLLLLWGCEKETKQPARENRTVRIGTGSVTGVYYPTGGAIAGMVNRTDGDKGFRITILSTGGSVYNINALQSGDLELGIVQSDRQAEAWDGRGDWAETGAVPALRSLFSLHSESVTLLASVESGILTVHDLKGKKVNIGNTGSGQRGNAIELMDFFLIDWEKDLETFSFKQTEAVTMLLDGRIDALFYTVGHPSASFTEATGGRREVRFVPITGIELLLEKYPYYTKSRIPLSFYPKAANDRDVETYGVKATLCSTAEVPEDIIYAIVREVFENLDEFRSLHPAFSQLTKEKMLDGLTAPFHKGALRYYREAGLME